MIRQQIKNSILKALEKLNYELPQGMPIEIDIPKEESHGDFSSNIALLMTKTVKKKPREVAESIAEAIERDNYGKIEIAGPGFINFFLKENLWRDLLKQITKEQINYGRGSQITDNKKINLEFVSVNPTGPMHVAHGRWAVLGDSIANVLRFAGYNVAREYYVNDYGNQVELLGMSLRARYLTLLGQNAPLPENGYKGDYLIALAEILKDKYTETLKDSPSEKFKEIAIEYMLNLIQESLNAAGVRFDIYFHESTLHKENRIQTALEKLISSGYTYKQDGALFFKSTALGDDKDRVLVKEDGDSTYFLADIAYHLNKIERGFDLLINIWGADHHGYVKRMKAGVAALGYNPDILRLIIGQLVTLTKEGAAVRMSKRAGEMVTFKELLDEVGKDAVRFIFLTKSTNSHLEFDIELAKKQSQENPVYYVQYAHARISSILRQAPSLPEIDSVGLNLINQKEEFDIIKKLEEFPSLVQICAKNYEAHQLTHFAQELAALFHSFYNKHRVLQNENEELTSARIYLIKAIKIVLNIIGDLLGVDMPERM